MLDVEQLVQLWDVVAPRLLRICLAVVRRLQRPCGLLRGIRGADRRGEVNKRWPEEPTTADFVLRTDNRRRQSKLSSKAKWIKTKELDTLTSHYYIPKTKQSLQTGAFSPASAVPSAAVREKASLLHHGPALRPSRSTQRRSQSYRLKASQMSHRDHLGAAQTQSATTFRRLMDVEFDDIVSL